MKHTLTDLAHLFPVVAAALAVACGSGPTRYNLAESTDHGVKAPLSFIVLSDTQYAEPYTDYDVKYRIGEELVNLPPALTSQFVGSFYRHAGAHFSVPFGMENVLTKESGKRAFGMFGGDLLEFACKNEADRLFGVLSDHPELPFVIALGNHDALFHGSYDTDAIGMQAEGPWDRYSFEMWDAVCKPHGGLFTKSQFIEAMLRYYELAWGLDFHAAIGLAKEEPLPANVPLSVGFRAKPRNGHTWDVAFSFRLDEGQSARSHRNSYLYQRFAHVPQPSTDPDLTITALDTTDYGTRRALCQAGANFVQIGMAGAVSSNQVKWLEALPKPRGQQLVLSHYLPVERVQDEATAKAVTSCDTALGMRCLGARVASALQPEGGPDPVYLYGHVHRPFRNEIATPTKDGPTLKLVRLPSLIDDKSYVAYGDGMFGEVDLATDERFESRVPLSTPGTTCLQRYREYTEIRRNVHCYVNKGTDGTAACAPLATVLAAAEPAAAIFCNDLARWKPAHQAQLATATADQCDPESPAEWRCILQRLTASLFDEAQVPEKDRVPLGALILASVESKPRKVPATAPPAPPPKPATARPVTSDACF